MNIKTKYNIGDIVYTNINGEICPFYINGIGVDVTTVNFDNELHTDILYFNKGAEFVYEPECASSKEELLKQMEL